MRHRHDKTAWETERQTSRSRNGVRNRPWLLVAGQPKSRRASAPTGLAPLEVAPERALKVGAHLPRQTPRRTLASYAGIEAAGHAGGCTRMTNSIRAWRADEGRLAGEALILRKHGNADVARIERHMRMMQQCCGEVAGEPADRYSRE